MNLWLQPDIVRPNKFVGFCSRHLFIARYVFGETVELNQYRNQRGNEIQQPIFIKLHLTTYLLQSYYLHLLSYDL